MGYYVHGLRDPFVEGCIRDLALALDGVSDEQFVQCRMLLLKEIGMLEDKGSGLSRRRMKRAVVQRTSKEAARTWPRIAMLLREKRALEPDGDEWD